MTNVRSYFLRTYNNKNWSDKLYISTYIYEHLLQTYEAYNEIIDKNNQYTVPDLRSRPHSSQHQANE